MKIKITLSLVALLFISTLRGQEVPNGESRTLLYTKTRCVECTFKGCVTLNQSVYQKTTIDGKIEISYGPITVSTYTFPCACSQGPVVPDFHDEHGNIPYPWNRLNGVLTSSKNSGSVRNFTRVTIDPYNSVFQGLFSGYKSDDDLFNIPEEQLLYLLDNQWPAGYPKVENGFPIPVPRLACGSAPEGWYTSGGNASELIELLEKIKDLKDQGASNDPLDAWAEKINKKLEKLQGGFGVTILDGTIDIGRGNHILYYGDCEWDFIFWKDMINSFSLKESLPPTNNSQDTIPTGYTDPNIWRHCYPITALYVSRLNDGTPIMNNTYNLQKDITIDLTSESSGTIVCVTAVLFNGEVISKKIIIP